VDRLPDPPSAWRGRDSSASTTFATGIVVSISEANLAQMTEAVLQDGYAIVQESVDGGEDGDARIFLLEGQILEQPREAGRLPATGSRPPSGECPLVTTPGQHQQGRTLSPSPDR
jgi:hypothetical protein